MIPTRNHGCLGDNIKVHWAGTENCEFAYTLNDAGAKYFLFTVLPFISAQFNIKFGRFTNAPHLSPWVELPKLGNHVIMDSGLFSLMFGACKDVKPDEKLIRRYKDAIVDFVHENKAYNLTCVECDCQKLLGTKLAWELREQFRKQLPNNRIINVFHFEDGKKGLDSLIDFAEYIAISVPELRIVKHKTYKEDVYQIASYIKERKPSIDIHLLGCTEYALLKKCRFCTSADSTAWQKINRFGTFDRFRRHDIKQEKLDECKEHIRNLIENRIGFEATDKRIEYYSNYWITAQILMHRYEKAAGPQD